MRPKSKANFMRAVKGHSASALYRDNIFGCELVWDGVRFVFPNRNGAHSMKNLFIFSMVKRDALRYLATHGVKEIKWASAVCYNKKADPLGRKLIGTDIDSAYWDIAYRMGIISERTYWKGLEIQDKNLLVASLSSLGRDKRYTQIAEGSFTKNIVIVKGDDDLKKIYRLIRFRCFGYMKKIAKIIGNDFVAYKTDCIYYLYSAENVRKIKAFLEQKELGYKMVNDFRNFDEFVED